MDGVLCACEAVRSFDTVLAEVRALQPYVSSSLRTTPSHRRRTGGLPVLEITAKGCIGASRAIPVLYGFAVQITRDWSRPVHSRRPAPAALPAPQPRPPASSRRRAGHGRPP